MASQGWKNYSTPIQDSAILAYQTVDSLPQNGISNSAAMREAGIIEKLLHSYGFIQCCERQDRLFFHYSQFQGNIEAVSHGDPVEFEMSYDRRTGKPVATNVIKVDPEMVSNGDIISDDRVTGTITTEIENDSGQGRITYENRGECFFLPYTKSDVFDQGVKCCVGDIVTFQIATDRTGNIHARHIRVDKANNPYQGVVCTLKDSFGFIERSDVVKEIFFHFSECKNFKDLKLGDDVQFGVQTRNNKEVAVNIEVLPEGTVVFEDLLADVIRGEIAKPIDRNQSPKHQNDPFPGSVKCVMDNVETFLPFSERDVNGDSTLFVNDQVEFNISVDRRDNMRRATNIEFLMKESFDQSDEKRETGIVFTVKDGFGFIKCANRDQPRLFFHFSEIIDSQVEVHVQDEVEFNVTQDAAIPNRQNAIRIQRLPRGSVTFNHVNNRNSGYHGVVEHEPAGQWFKNKVSNNEEENNQENRAGVISYYINDTLNRIQYVLKDCVEPKNLPKADDKVEFNVSHNGNGSPHAVDIKLMSSRGHVNGIKNGFNYTSQGFIAALRENFGFIEAEDHSREIFFHYSVFDGDSNKLELGQEVEYALSQKCIGNSSGKLSAEAVRKITNGSIPTEEPKGEVLTGIIQRPIRCFNPDQEEYSGLIKIKSEENENSAVYSFGITSLVDKKVFVQNGDVCEFQIGSIENGEDRAVKIKAVRDRIKATVEAIKGQYGFLSHEVEEGKKLFFHKSEVKDNSMLKPGDVVDFVIIKNHRNGRFSACDVKLISEASASTPRPEHLTRLRNMSLSQDDSTPRIVIIRQPGGPDNDSNFKNHPMLNST